MDWFQSFTMIKFFLISFSSRSSSRCSTTRSNALPSTTTLVKSYRTESQESNNSDKTGANDDDKRPRGICINHLPLRSTGTEWWLVLFCTSQSMKFPSKLSVRLFWIIVTPKTSLFFMYIMIKQSENYFTSVISSFLHAYIDNILHYTAVTFFRGKKL